MATAKRTYLIGIKSDRGNYLCIHVNGDTPSRPFSIANNLWNYETPWHAAQQLKRLANSWSCCGHKVTGIFGTVADMPAKGDRDNVFAARRDWTEA